ncbi:MAG: stage II sporulation protein M [archaeon]
MKKRKRGFSLKNEYVDSLDYLKKSKKFIYVSIGVFFFFALIGFFIPVSDSIKGQIIELLKEILEKTENMNSFQLIRFIFFNNLQSSFLGMMLGVFLGIFPLITIILNGYLLGFVSLMAINEGGIFVLWRLLPHGIFELPAVFISVGLGLKFGIFIFQKDRVESFRNFLWNSLRVFLFIVIPLLIIAAIIEGILITLF